MFKREQGPPAVTGIVTSEHKKPAKPLSRKAKALMAAGLLAALLVGYLAYAALTSKHQQTVDTKKNAIQTAQNTVNNALDAAPGSAEYVAALKELQSQESKMTSSADKAFVYIQMASLALNAQRYEEALGYAQKAEQLHATATSAQVTAKAQAGLGNKEAAITSYKLAISRLNPKSELQRGDIMEYQQAIKDLGGTP